jgi:aspartyl aminopeptidase
MIRVGGMHMSKELDFAKELVDFIYDSPTAYHAADSSARILKANGFTELKEEAAWKLKKGGKYYIVKNNSALIAFTMGGGPVQEEGFRIIGAHTDAPTFRIKLPEA